MKKTILSLGGLLLLTCTLFGQEPTFTCENEAYIFLSKLKGEWTVQTKDRTSPGNYEENSGRSTFSDLIEGCGVRESYRGVFRGSSYAREVSLIGVDATVVKMTTLDSEHNGFSLFEGGIENEVLQLLWYRDKEVKRLQSKYMLKFDDTDVFSFSSYLSTDHGETWALTHERVYTRAD